MHTDLTPAQCEELLTQCHYAHLGCVEDGTPFVFPITYVYKEGSIHGFSLEGHKVDIMRRNPEVCVQVEHVDGEHAWQSVMCWGTYEEVTDPKTAQNVKGLFGQLHGDALLKGEEPAVSRIVEGWQKHEGESVVYRIKPVRMTGKGE